MPLQLLKNQTTGFSANYWVITNISLDYSNQRGQIILSLYKDSTAFSGAKDFVTQVKVDIKGADWTTLSGSKAILTDAYIITQTNALFLGSQVVA